MFDPFEGKNFELVLSKKGGYPNYDSCKFQGTRSTMQINAENVTDTNEGRALVLDYLKDAPDLSNFDYKTWNDEQRNKVMNIVSQYSSPGSSIDTITKASPKASPKDSPKANEQTSSEQDTDTSDDDVPASKYGDEFDDFLNGLDL